MTLVIGRRYLFMTQRYSFAGTVVSQTPTHVVLGNDAVVGYEDIGPFEEWADGRIRDFAMSGSVPGQIVCMLGCDVTPIP